MAQKNITAENHQKYVDDIEVFKEQVMTGIVPSTVFPDIYMPRAIYYYITKHHNESMCKWLEAVTNEDTLHPLTHDYWTLKHLDNFNNKSSANSELVAEDKTTIKANLSEETETDDEKASDGNDGMYIEDGKDNVSNDAQISSEFDEKVRSQEKQAHLEAQMAYTGKGNDQKEQQKEVV